jgi:hypothetical protein
MWWLGDLHRDGVNAIHVANHYITADDGADAGGRSCETPDFQTNDHDLRRAREKTARLSLWAASPLFDPLNKSW